MSLSTGGTLGTILVAVFTVGLISSTARAQFMIPPVPFLELPADGSYAGDGIEPNEGDTNTDFTFRVLYSHTLGTKPLYVEACFVGQENFCRRQTGYTYDNGRYYEPTETLEQVTVKFNQPGQYQYFFRANEGGFIVRYPADGYLPLTVHGASTTTSVLFIPGIEASRLYSADTGSEKRLWEPLQDADVKKLFLDDQGHSLLPGIYTRDIIDEAFGYNIYKKFGEFMDGLADEGVIAGWQAIPYDWRIDAAAHVPAVIERIQNLAENSPENKITLIAHSNGGLIAKAVLRELQRQKAAAENTLIDSVDRVILVAVPQLGTPKSIPSMLHGFDLDLAKGLVLNQAVARALAQYMPSAFNLLPAEQYFARMEEEPVVVFDASVDRVINWRTKYGETIDSASELRSLLTGGEGAWSQPNLSDIISPIVLKDHFLDTAAANHAGWQELSLPAHIQVVQIAGWGLDTVKAVRYTGKRVWSCGEASPTFCHDRYKLDYEPVFTTDGDKTVVIPSAIESQGENYYINIYRYNREFGRLRRNREHANIIEVEGLQNLIKNIIIGDDDLPANITRNKPNSLNEEDRLRVSVHSPVSLRVCSEAPGDDGQPLCAGAEPITGSDLTRKVEDIANSYYLEFGEGKFIGFSAGESHTIMLEGEKAGTFSLEIEEVAGEAVIDTLLYEDIPVAAGMAASLTLDTVAQAGNLRIDYEGNGVIEAIIKPGENLTVRQLVDLLQVKLAQLRLKKGEWTSISAHIKNIIKFLEKKQKNTRPIESQLKNIAKKIDEAGGRSITAEEATEIIKIVNIIKERL